MTTINYRDAAATMRAALAREEAVYKHAGDHSAERVTEAAKRIKALKRALEGAK